MSKNRILDLRDINIPPEIARHLDVRLHHIMADEDRRWFRVEKSTKIIESLGVRDAYRPIPVAHSENRRRSRADAPLPIPAEERRRLEIGDFPCIPTNVGPVVHRDTGPWPPPFLSAGGSITTSIVSLSAKPIGP